MKPQAWIPIGTLCLALVIAINSCVTLSKLEEIASRLSEVRPDDKSVTQSGKPNTKAGETNTLELCRQGLTLLDKNEDNLEGGNDAAENGGAMVQNAWTLQSLYPMVVPRIWAMTKKWAEKLPLDRRYLTLSLYLQSVNDAIEFCENPDEFALLWGVKKDVTSMIQKIEHQRTNALSIQLAKLIREIKGKGVEPVLLKTGFSKELEDIRTKLEAESGIYDESQKIVSDHLQTIKGELSSWYDHQIKAIEERYAKEKEGEIDDPVLEKKGTYTILLADVGEVWRKWMSPEAQFWMNMDSSSNDIEVNPKSIVQRLQKLESNILRSVRIRYNIWATSKIQTAGNQGGTGGVVKLANIDNGLLDPSVRSLFLTAESKVFETIKNVKDRPRHVRTMLVTEKFGLDAF